jgi:hypothetical protein
MAPFLRGTGSALKVPLKKVGDRKRPLLKGETENALKVPLLKGRQCDRLVPPKVATAVDLGGSRLRKK